MANVVSLAAYRGQQRKQYLQKNQNRLDRFVKAFVARHLVTSYSLITEYYFSLQNDANTGMWDYQDLRDIIHEAIDAAFGEELWREAQAQFWFDDRFLTRELMVELCFSRYIMVETNAVSV